MKNIYPVFFKEMGIKTATIFHEHINILLVLRQASIAIVMLQEAVKDIYKIL